MRWLLVLVVLLSADPPEQADSAKAKSPKKSADSTSQADKKKPIRLRKRGDAAPREKKLARPDVDKRPPPTPAKNVPKKDDKPGLSDLDKQLLKQFGGKAKATKQPGGQSPLMRVGENMRKVEGRLAKLEGDQETVGLQKKILDDLEELLKQASRRPSSKKQKKQKQRKQNQQQQLKRQQGKQQGKAAKRPSSRAAQKAGRGRADRMGLGRNAEEKDVWGHLSSMMRQELNQYAKENFLEKYREYLEAYYTAIATKSRSASE